MPKIIQEVDLVLRHQILLQTQIQRIGRFGTFLCPSIRVELYPSKVLQYMIMIRKPTGTLIKLVVVVLKVLVKVLPTLMILHHLLILALLLPFLIVGQPTEEKAVFVLLLPVLDHLDELVCHGVANAF